MLVAILWARTTPGLVVNIHGYSVGADPEHKHNAALLFLGAQPDATPPPSVRQMTREQVEDLSNIGDYGAFMDFLKALP